MNDAHNTTKPLQLFFPKISTITNLTHAVTHAHTAMQTSTQYHPTMLQLDFPHLKTKVESLSCLFTSI